MPNWVYNTVQITGSESDIAQFVNHIEHKPDFVTEDEWLTNNRRFSFHSFVTLDPEHHEEYHGINGWEDGEHKGQTPYNWYNWNNSNWNTKWDACEVDIDSQSTSISIRFSTAWAPPEPVFIAMSEQFPNLDFDIHWEEEQGFGAEFTMKNGNVLTLDTWDIPSCHADHDKRGSDCVCEYYDDPSDWYDDCPGKVHKIYEIEVITKYKVKANNYETALEAVRAEEAGNDSVEGAEIVSVAYSDEYRLTGETQDGTTEPTE